MRVKRCHLVLLGAALSLGCEPTGPLPGGELSGEVVAELPSDWSFSDDWENVQLETRPEDPYSVNVWGVGVGDRFYLGSGEGGESTWTQHIGEDSAVRLRVGEQIYELSAVRIEDAEERDRFLAAMKRKYDWEPSAEESDRAWVFRLDPR